MDIKIFSLFPEMFEGPLGSSLIGKAREQRKNLNIHELHLSQTTRQE